MGRGQFISIEGTEGAGKSTALSFIKCYLEKIEKCTVLVTREPGGTELAEDIRQLLLHPIKNEVLLPTSELLLMFACRAQHISLSIKPALEAGKYVLSDRYIDASYAYQGGGRGLDVNFITMLDKMVVDNLYPDLTLLLDVSADLGITRTERRGLQKDRIEQEKIDFFERVCNTYLERANKDPKRIKVIDANVALAQVQMQIETVLNTFFARSRT